MSAPQNDLSVMSPPAPPRTVAPAPSRWARVVERLRAGADELLQTRPDPGPLESGIFRRVLVLWVTARALSLALLWGFYEISRASRWTFGPSGERVGTFLDFLTGWDADRYGQIAQHGYPVFLPMNLAGDILPNNWAFMPVLPLLERGLSTATGMSWQLAGVLISIAASLGATWFLFLLLRRVTTPTAAWWGIVIFSFGPLSFVFVLGYAESLLLMLLFAALLLTLQRRYLLIAPIGVVAAFTRPGALALALALGIVFVVRFLRRRDDPFPLPEAAKLFVAGMSTAIAGLSWTHIADAVTGVRNAYIRTEMGWWLQSVGSDEFVPLTPWFRQAGTHLGAIGIVLVIALMIGFVMLMWSRPVRRLGLVVVAFAFSYGLYLFAVFLPQQSTFRLMMPMSPLLGDERWSSTPRRRVAILVGCIALQALCVWQLWTINHP